MKSSQNLDVTKILNLTKSGMLLECEMPQKSQNSRYQKIIPKPLILNSQNPFGIPKY
jgi:hypothetical protein